MYRFKINGKSYEVCIKDASGSKASVTVNGVAYDVDIEDNGTSPQTASAANASTVTPGHDVAGLVSSPLPGVVINVLVRQGDSVRRGQKIAVIEAMKMENDILSPKDGTVVSLKVTKGDSVLEGAEIATIA